MNVKKTKPILLSYVKGCREKKVVHQLLNCADANTLCCLPAVKAGGEVRRSTLPDLLSALWPLVWDCEPCTSPHFEMPPGPFSPRHSFHYLVVFTLQLASVGAVQVSDPRSQQIVDRTYCNARIIPSPYVEPDGWWV